MKTENKFMFYSVFLAIILVGITLFMLTFTKDENTKIIITLFCIPVSVLIYEKFCEMYFKAINTSYTDLLEENEKLYKMGAITFEAYHKRKNELIESVNKNTLYAELNLQESYKKLLYHDSDENK